MGGSSKDICPVVLRDEVRAEDGITSWLPMSQPLIDPINFFTKFTPNFEKIGNITFESDFSHFFKVVSLQTFKTKRGRSR